MPRRLAGASDKRLGVDMRLTETTSGRYLDEHGALWSAFSGRYHPVLCRDCHTYTVAGFYRDPPAEYTVRCPGCITVTDLDLCDRSYLAEDVGHCGPLSAIVNARIADEVREPLPADVRRIVAQVADMLQAGYLNSDHVQPARVYADLAAVAV